MADSDDVLALWRDGFEADEISRITDRSSAACSEIVQAEVRRLMHDSACGIELKHRDGSVWRCSGCIATVGDDGRWKSPEISLDCRDGERVMRSVRPADPRWRDFRLVQGDDRHETAAELHELLLNLCEQVDKYGLEYGHKMPTDVQAWWERNKTRT